MADGADGAASALALALRVDGAALRSPVDGEGDEAAVSLLDARVRMDVAADGAVAAGLAGRVFCASGGSLGARGAARTLEEARAAASGARAQPLALLADAGERERVRDVKWVGDELLAVGYATGVVRVLARDGRLRFEQKLHSVGVTKLDVNHCVSIAGGRRPFGGGAQRDSELWILYEDATVAIVQMAELLGQINATMFGPAQASKFRKYSLRDQSDILAAVPCGSVRPTIFQAHARIGVQSIISAGSSPFISFYQAGNDHNSIVHLAHIATAMATRAAGAMWNFAKSWGWSGAKNEDGELQQAAASYAQIGSGAIDAAAEHVPAPIHSSRGIFDDERRRCRVLVLSPNGRLAAISDTLGRIMLVDTSRMIIIRMWKGYRYAQCGWMQAVEGARRPQGLYLVIYSAQRGIVEVWRAQYGPRVFTLAVGDSARLFTRVDPVTRKAKCFIVTKADERMSEVFELKPGLPTPAILMKYFTQNRLQEENFLVHQIIGGLHAFVKKRTEKTGVSDCGSLDTLLDSIGKLSSLATFDSLLEVLLNSEMSPLGASFLLRALERIEMTLTSSMATRTPTGQEILFGWNIQWLHRLVHAFIGFETEFRRSYQGFLSNTEGKSLREAVAAKIQTGELTRLIPWLELYRRAGFLIDDDSRVKTRKVVEAASRLNAWVFLEYFSMPFSDPELARRRDILALHEDAESREAFSREVFHTLQLSVLRSFPSSARKDCFLAFIFLPVLSSVFAVQEIQSLHDSIFLPRTTQTSLFLEWFLSLPLGVVLGLPPPAQSSALQRWLQPLLATSTADEFPSIENDATTAEGAFLPKKSVRHLTGCTPDMKTVFSACWRTSKLFHAFILSQYCCWGEVQAAKHLEEATLGKITSVGSGVRWRVLEDCIAKTVHLSLRLGRAGRLTVEAVENVDEIMRAVAVMQINGGHEPGEDDLTIPPSNPSGSVAHGPKDVDLDGWVADMEHCRNAQAMKDWSAVIVAFPQFSEADSLCCFRVSVLCAAWNSERSDMQQLEDALLELDALSGLALKAALAVYIWEKYIRVHVVTLISFWEESAAGRKPQRGLQPQVARRFFGIIKNLLLIVSTCAKTLHTSANSADHQALRVEMDDAHDDDDDDDEISDEIEMVFEYKLESLADDARWGVPVSELRGVYGRRWPPSRDEASLMRALAAFDFRELSLDQITDHTSLILLLDSFAATAVTPVSIVKLFPNRGSSLCRPNTFLMASKVAVETTNQPHLEEVIQSERSAFLKQLVRYDEALGFSLADAFGLSLEVIREEHVVFLYQSGQDELGDLWMDKMKHPDRLVSKLGSIARARLAIILQRMKAEPQYAMIMSVLPADVFLWVINISQPPLVADPVVENLDRAPSLTATHHLLLQCLALIPVPEGEEFEKVSAMSVLVKDVISQVKQQQGQTPT